MRTFSRREIERLLRDRGIVPASRGDGTGHTVWCDARGRQCRPKFCKNEISLPHLYALGDELESKGMGTRRELMVAAKQR